MLTARLPSSEHHRDRLRQESARDKSEHSSRGIIEPLKIVHDAQQRLLLGHGSNQAKRGQRHEEPVRRIPGRTTQRHGEGNLLRLGERTELVKHRRAQLVHPGVCQLHLRLDAPDLSYPKVRGLLRGVTQKRRLTHARLATDREHSTVPAAHLVEHLV